jgi:hypothetical protein
MKTRHRRSTHTGHGVLIVLFLLLTSPHEAFAQIQAVSAELVDSNGTVVGTILDYHGPLGVATVALIIDGHSTILAFTPNSVDTFASAGGSGVFFASADCTGQGFALSFGPDEFLEPQAVGGTNNTFYAGPRSAIVPGPFSYNSVLRHGQACSTESATLTNALPVSPVRSLTPPWLPPFRLEGSPAASSVPAVSSLGLLALAVALGGGGMLLLRLRYAEP